jgi:predicted RNA binding protein YcfA (HicA-like mRNA interferase family)
VPKPAIETNRRRVVARLEREGWIERHGGEDDIYIHTARPGRIIAVPPHRTLSPGVARKIAKEAGWL